MAAFLFRESKCQIASQREADDPDSLISDFRLHRNVTSGIVQGLDIGKEHLRLNRRTPLPGAIEKVRNENRVSGRRQRLENSILSPIPLRPSSTVHQQYRQVSASAFRIEALDRDGLVIAMKYGRRTDRGLGAGRLRQNGKGNEQIEASTHWKSQREALNLPASRRTAGRRHQSGHRCCYRWTGSPARRPWSCRRFRVPRSG